MLRYLQHDDVSISEEDSILGFEAIPRPPIGRNNNDPSLLTGVDIDRGASSTGKFHMMVHHVCLDAASNS